MKLFLVDNDVLAGNLSFRKATTKGENMSIIVAALLLQIVSRKLPNHLNSNDIILLPRNNHYNIVLLYGMEGLY